MVQFSTSPSAADSFRLAQIMQKNSRAGKRKIYFLGEGRPVCFYNGSDDGYPLFLVNII